MKSFKVSIPYTPKAKGSVRLGRSGAYNPSVGGMTLMRKYVQKQLADAPQPLLKGSLLVMVHYKIPVPTSHPERKRKPQNCLPHIKRPDGDNLDKFLGDALEGVLWEDDSRIAFQFRAKTLTIDKVGKTELFVCELPPGVVSFAKILEEIGKNLPEIDYDKIEP